MNNVKNTGLDFDATNIAPATVNEVLPNGWYNCEVKDAEVLPTKGAGNNERVKIDYKVLDGDFTGRLIFDSINHKHTKANVQEIGQRELSAVCHATGVLNLTTALGGVAQFIGQVLQVKVGLGKTTATYPDPSNEVKGRKAIEGAIVAGAPAPGSAPAPVAAAPNFGAPAPGAVPSPPVAVAPVPVAQPVAPVVVANPIETALADGWVAHPESAGYFYKGQEVLLEADVIARYPTPVATPPPVAAAPVAPATPVAATPPFNTPAPAVAPAPAPTPIAAAPSAGGVPAVATGAPPAWATQ